jgi:hypothetical protein
MKNLKSIVATIVLTGTLALNSFAGVIVFKADENTDKKPQQCKVETDGVIVFGAIVSLVSSTVGLDGVIVFDAKETCDTNQKDGVIVF